MNKIWLIVVIVGGIISFCFAGVYLRNQEMKIMFDRQTAIEQHQLAVAQGQGNYKLQKAELQRRSFGFALADY